MQVPRAGGCVVLGILHRFLDRLHTARDESDDESRRGAERRRALARIEHTESPGRAGSHVQEAATALESLRNGVDRLNNRWTRSLNGRVYPCTVGKHRGNELFSPQDVQVFQALGRGLGLQSGEFRAQAREIVGVSRASLFRHGGCTFPG